MLYEKFNLQELIKTYKTLNSLLECGLISDKKMIAEIAKSKEQVVIAIGLKVDSIKNSKFNNTAEENNKNYENNDENNNDNDENNNDNDKHIDDDNDNISSNNDEKYETYDNNNISSNSDEIICETYEMNNETYYETYDMNDKTYDKTYDETYDKSEEWIGQEELEDREYFVIVIFSDGLQISNGKTNPQETLSFLKSQALINLVQIRPVNKINIHIYETGELFMSYEINPMITHLESLRGVQRKQKRHQHSKECQCNMSQIFQQQFHDLVGQLNL